MSERFRRALGALPRFETAVLLVATACLIALGVASDRRPGGPRFATYSTYDSAGGGYAVFYELLGREGVRVSRFDARPAFLDGSLDTLVWSEPLPFDPGQVRTTMADVRALEAWVRAGGRLVYVGHDDAAAATGLLKLPSSRTRDMRAHVQRIAPELRAAGVAVLEPTQSLRWRVMKPGVRVIFDDGTGPLVVRYAFGRGTVTALIDESLLMNAAIGAHDRARLAVFLTAPSRAGATLAFDEAVHGFLKPIHWWSVVPRGFVIALAIAVLALLVAFAGAAVRLGPPLVPAPRDDRSTSDFIDGLASLLERGGAAHSALLDALASTSLAAARALGLGDGASHDEIAARIESEELRADYRELTTIATKEPAGDSNVVRGAGLAQRIRKEFAAHGR